MITRRAMHPVAVEIMDSLYQHRVLTTAQIREMHAPDWRSPRAIEQLLSEPKGSTGLLERGLAAYVQHRKAASSVGALRVWFLTETGCEAVEAVGHSPLERKMVAPEQAAGVLQHHTLAVNDVGIAWMRAARERGDECKPLAWKHEVAHALEAREQNRRPEYVVADIVLTYLRTEEARFERRFIEVDRGTESLAQIVDHLRRYAKLKAYESGRRDATYTPFPGVVIVLMGGELAQREQRMKLIALLAHRQAEHAGAAWPPIDVSFVMYEDLMEMGPFEGCFYPADDLHRLVNWLGES